jgi:hypothetical protein
VLVLVVLNVRPEMSMGCTIGDLVDAPLAKPRDLMALVAECRPNAEAQQKLARTNTTFMMMDGDYCCNDTNNTWCGAVVDDVVGGKSFGVKLPSDSVSL